MCSSDLFALRFAVPYGHKSLVEVSVDGIDAMSGKPTEVESRGIVLCPPCHCGNADLPGFLAQDGVSPFTFPANDDPRVDQVGIISVVFYAELSPVSAAFRARIQRPKPTTVQAHTFVRGFGMNGVYTPTTAPFERGPALTRFSILYVRDIEPVKRTLSSSAGSPT